MTAVATPAVASPVGQYRCGHCAGNAHERCPGAIDSGKALWVCPCGCVEERRCIACKSTEGVTDKWRCADKDECDAVVAARVAKDPVIRMIREVTERAHAREAAERAARPAHAAPDTPRPAAGKCECGCGAATKSRFAMGHDARLRGQLQRAFRGDPANGVDADMDAGRELAARGGIWAAKAPNVEPPADPEAFIAARVAARLEAQA